MMHAIRNKLCMHSLTPQYLPIKNIIIPYKMEKRGKGLFLATCFFSPPLIILRNKHKF